MAFHELSLSTLEYHVLLALASGPAHGYAIRDAVEGESAGTLTPRPGTLYRVISRLLAEGLAYETEPEEDPGPHPGRSRRYYALSLDGRAALAKEARRLRGAAALAEERLRLSPP
jgi:DNA-binding PadR family transcriptional regulator